jgi:UDP-N-acetylmuramoyl-tripeptide--D-alanyl-D-alanine ligase
MKRFNPQSLAAWTGGRWHADQIPEEIVGFCFDARQLQAGECFVALSGGARDGHEFVAQAAQLGASALLVERPQALPLPQLIVENSLDAMAALGAGVRRRFDAPVVGITGSCGKTSTKEMLRLLLGYSRTHATAGNWNNRIGVPMTLFGLDPEQQDFAVIEAGINQPDEMAALGAMIAADLTVVTNIAAAHLELLRSIENVAAEKAQLALRAKPNSPIVLPSGAFRHPAFAALADRAVVLAAEGEPLPYEPHRVVRYRLENAGPESGIVHLTDGTEASFQVASPSAGICVNAALAIVAARELGMCDADIRTRLEAWRPSSTRGRIAQAGRQTFYIDCYNANPASMLDALLAFRRAMSSDRPRCYVLGAMNELGCGAVELHREVGRNLALRPEDRAFLVGPCALVDAYRDGALETGSDSAQLVTVADVEQIHSEVAEFTGALFVKGSRAYALETLLPLELS